MQEKATSKDGTAIAYWRSGRGRPLVLVHGTTADHTRWEPMLGLLEPHATLCAMDRRGRGGSGDAEPYAIEREFEDVAAVVDAVAGEAAGGVDVFGHSFGALCALEAARLTANVRRLVLYEPPALPGGSPPGFHERMEALLAEGRRDEAVERFFRELVGLADEDVARMRAHPSWRTRVAAAHTLPREDRAESAFGFDPARYRTLRAPTLMLLGDRSPPFLRASTEAVAAALPNVRVAALEGQAHMALSAAPRLVADAVLPFLGEGSA